MSDTALCMCNIFCAEIMLTHDLEDFALWQDRSPSGCHLLQDIKCTSRNHNCFLFCYKLIFFRFLIILIYSSLFQVAQEYFNFDVFWVHMESNELTILVFLDNAHEVKNINFILLTNGKYISLKILSVKWFSLFQIK